MDYSLVIVKNVSDYLDVVIIFFDLFYNIVHLRTVFDD